MVWLGITEAAVKLGMTTYMVRKMARAGDLSAEQIGWAGGAKWFIDVPEEPEQDPDQPANVEIEDQEPPHHGNHHNNDEVVEILRQQLDEKDRQLEARTREISELHQLLAAKVLEGPRNKPWWKIW